MGSSINVPLRDSASPLMMLNSASAAMIQRPSSSAVARLTYGDMSLLLEELLQEQGYYELQAVGTAATGTSPIDHELATLEEK